MNDPHWCLIHVAAWKMVSAFIHPETKKIIKIIGSDKKKIRKALEVRLI